MSNAIRIILMKILILVLSLTVPAALSAQESTTAGAATTPAAPGAPADAAPALTVTDAQTRAAAEAPDGETRHEIRSEFANLLRRHPSQVARILALDPELLSNDLFLARYPELGSFVTQHPQIRANPHYYLQPFQHVEGPTEGGVEQIVESLTVMSTLLLVGLALSWFVRTIIEQKRWNRLSRTQSEVHNKILDRFGTSTELLEYIRTPAGTKFLESAPIPLHTENTAQKTPVTRVLWSVQIGIVVAAAGLGMFLISGSFDSESAQALFAVGAIALSVGIGFIGSAAVSLFLSQRLGLWQPPESSENAAVVSSMRSDG